MTIDKSRTLRKIGAQGILTEEDLPALGSQRRLVYNLMRDKQWHSGPEICLVAGGTEGLRRLRELRELPGVVIERQRNKKARCHYYLMTVNVPTFSPQLELI